MGALGFTRNAALESDISVLVVGVLAIEAGEDAGTVLFD